MHRVIIFAVLILLLLLNAAIAAEIEVIETDVERQEIVLRNPETGEQKAYVIGDEIEGWRIREIKATSISLSHPPTRKGGPVLMKIAPVQNSRNIIRTIPRPEE